MHCRDHPSIFGLGRSPSTRYSQQGRAQATAQPRHLSVPPAHEELHRCLNTNGGGHASKEEKVAHCQQTAVEEQQHTKEREQEAKRGQAKPDLWQGKGGAQMLVSQRTCKGEHILSYCSVANPFLRASHRIFSLRWSFSHDPPGNMTAAQRGAAAQRPRALAAAAAVCARLAPPPQVLQVQQHVCLQVRREDHGQATSRALWPSDR
jgi:hypothetical protein